MTEAVWPLSFLEKKTARTKRGNCEWINRWNKDTKYRDESQKCERTIIKGDRQSERSGIMIQKKGKKTKSKAVVCPAPPTLSLVAPPLFIHSHWRTCRTQGTTHTHGTMHATKWKPLKRNCCRGSKPKLNAPTFLTSFLFCLLCVCVCVWWGLSEQDWLWLTDCSCVHFSLPLSLLWVCVCVWMLECVGGWLSWTDMLLALVHSDPPYSHTHTHTQIDIHHHTTQTHTHTHSNFCSNLPMWLWKWHFFFCHLKKWLQLSVNSHCET